MKHSIVVCLVIMISFSGCSKDKLPDDIPACLKERIQAIQKENYFTRVDEYLFREKKIYVLSAPPEPDAMSPVLNDNCEGFCGLGGIAGNTTCDGEKFSEAAVFVRNIWKR